MDARRDQPGDVRHVDEQDRTDAVAISAIRSKSHDRGYALAPPTIIFGRTSRAWVSIAS